VSISEGLKITADVVNNVVFQEIIKNTIKEVEDGNPISTILVESEEIPKMVAQMMNIGEETGRLDLILSNISDFYAREIDNMVNNLMTLMEPIIMVVMGIAVGIMVAAIILPMYNMATNL
jgi:type IV pilus assembly protein PilC